MFNIYLIMLCAFCALALVEMSKRSISTNQKPALMTTDQSQASKVTYHETLQWNLLGNLNPRQLTLSQPTSGAFKILIFKRILHYRKSKQRTQVPPPSEFWCVWWEEKILKKFSRTKNDVENWEYLNCKLLLFNFYVNDALLYLWTKHWRGFKK